MKIVSWNLEGRLSNLATGERGTPKRIVAALKRFNADIVVHPEAWSGSFGIDQAADRELATLGYTKIAVDYNDQYPRDWNPVPRPQLCILTRLKVISTDTIRPGGLRSMPVAVVEDPQSGEPVRIIAIHLEDRKEAYRLEQAEALIEYINGSTVPTIMCGDFNAMPPDVLRSRLIHSGAFRALAKLVPHGHMRYTLTRLSEMATGTTIAAIFSKTRLQNTDPRFTPTTTPKMKGMEWMPSIRFAKIDWMFVSPDVVYDDFRISRDLGSDHRALSLHISLKK